MSSLNPSPKLVGEGPTEEGRQINGNQSENQTKVLSRGGDHAPVCSKSHFTTQIIGLKAHHPNRTPITFSSVSENVGHSWNWWKLLIMTQRQLITAWWRKYRNLFYTLRSASYQRSKKAIRNYFLVCAGALNAGRHEMSMVLKHNKSQGHTRNSPQIPKLRETLVYAQPAYFQPLACMLSYFRWITGATQNWSEGNMMATWEMWQEPPSQNNNTLHPASLGPEIRQLRRSVAAWRDHASSHKVGVRFWSKWGYFFDDPEGCR